MSPERPLRSENKQLLDELETLRDHPRAALVAMQTAMDLDIGFQLGFAPEVVGLQPDAVERVPLTPVQYEVIKSFEEIIRVFCKHAVLNPRQFGFWFNERHPKLGDRSPLELLFSDVSEKGFDTNKVRCVVVEAATTFFSPSDEAQQDIQALYLR